MKSTSRDIRATLVTLIVIGSLATTALVYSPSIFAQPPSDIPPEIKKYTLVNLNAALIRQKVSQGEAVDIVLADKSYQLRLAYDDLRARGCKLIVRSVNSVTESRCPDPQTYKGKVIGIDNSDVRLTVTTKSVKGYVSFEEEWFFIEPLSDYKKTADDFTHFIYRTKDVVFTIDLSNDSIPAPTDKSSSQSRSSGIGEVLAYTATVELMTHRYTPVLTADIILDGDPEFYNINPSTWATRQTEVLNGVEGIYENQLDITYRVAAQATWVIGGPLTSTTCNEARIRNRAVNSNI